MMLGSEVNLACARQPWMQIANQGAWIRRQSVGVPFGNWPASHKAKRHGSTNREAPEPVPLSRLFVNRASPRSSASNSPRCSPACSRFGIAATCEGCPLPLFGAMLLLRPRNADEDAVFLRDATLEFRASRGVTGVMRRRSVGVS